MIHTLLLVSENYTNGYRPESLNIIFLTSIYAAIFVIISKNPIVSVLFLIGLFLSIACYLLVLGISFIGLSYLLVYVGAVSILFLFILMLINVRISELLSDTSNTIPLVLMIAVYFNYPISEILPAHAINIYNLKFNAIMWNGDRLPLLETDNNYNLDSYDNVISFVTSKFWDGSLAEATHITSIGNVMYTSYSIWLVITSIILLLAMVGAIIITIKQKN